MPPRATWLIALAAIACGGKQHTAIKAGDEKDEGAGELARASTKLQTPEGTGPTGFDDDERIARRTGYGEYGGDSYGGDMYGGGFGGDAYGGSGYAGWTMPQWNYQQANRMPRYVVNSGLTGAVEGTVTWTGAEPAKLATPCGALDNPTLRLGREKAMRGVIVYIDKINVGRGTPYYSRPIGVGGVISKRGCTFVPAAAIVAPLPGAATINGDPTHARVRVTPPGAPPVVSELQEGGVVQVEIKPGVTRVDAEDGKLGAAWVLGLETPYYAITDDAGRYRIDELAAGTYDVVFWQPPVASIAADGTWTYGAPIIAHRSIKIDAKPAHLSVSLSGR